MTKREKTDKNQEAKPVNQTAHRRAMKNSKTNAAFSSLRERWDGMSDEQRGEQLIELIRLKCSVRGIADDLGEKESNLRRYIGSAKTTGTNSGWIGRMERTLAKRPLTPKTKSACEVADCKPSAAPAKKGSRSVTEEMDPVENDVHSSTTPHAKEIALSSSTVAQERPVVNHASRDKESRPGEHDLSISSGPITEDRIRRLAGIADSIKARPVWDAHSMERQGIPLPPVDPKGTVS
jgi:hypothetical protein